MFNTSGCPKSSPSTAHPQDAPKRKKQPVIFSIASTCSNHLYYPKFLQFALASSSLILPSPALGLSEGLSASPEISYLLKRFLGSLAPEALHRGTHHLLPAGSISFFVATFVFRTPHLISRRGFSTGGQLGIQAHAVVSEDLANEASGAESFLGDQI